MSIYRHRGSRRPLSDVEVEHVPRTRQVESESPTPGEAILRLRRANPVSLLLPRTSSWIDSLPKDVRPSALPKQFARIANHLCAVWSDSVARSRYFTELLCDTRGGRRGFPPVVLHELESLQNHCASLGAESDSDAIWNRLNRSPWDGPNRE